MFFVALCGFWLALVAVGVFAFACDTWKNRRDNDFIFALCLFVFSAAPASGAFMLFVRAVQIANGG